VSQRDHYLSRLDETNEAIERALLEHAGAALFTGATSYGQPVVHSESARALALVRTNLEQAQMWLARAKEKA
jgi:hypothetical protein